LVAVDRNVFKTATGCSRALQTDLDYINSDEFVPDGQIKGIGLIEVDLGRDFHGKDLIVYDTKGNPKITIRVTESNVTTTLGGKSYSRNDNSNPFNPRYFGDNPDYFVLVFDCTKSTDKYYHVVVDQKTNEIGLIKKVDSLFKFETVSTYVSEWTTLGLDFDRLQNPLRQEPSDNAAVILNEDTKKYMHKRCRPFGHQDSAEKFGYEKYKCRILEV
jgi:hypothetical protein